MKNYFPNNPKSQIAVIITFVIAVIFLFIAVFINLAKVSQVKTTTSTSADKAALGLSSQLGSMSHYYKEKVLKISGSCTSAAPCQACNTDWLSLTVLIGIVAAIGLAALSVPAVIIAGPLAVTISMSVLGGISAKYKEMTGYNAFRESALFQALAAIQNDDVEVKATAPGSGIFYDDTNNNGVFDAGEPSYDLRAIPEMRNARKVSRFAAWYYTLRLPLVSDESMNNSLENFRNRLTDFIDADEWDPDKWQIKRVAYVIKQLPTVGGLSDFTITCNLPSQSNPHPPNQCPDWVKDNHIDTQYKQLRIIRMDAADNVSGGFLKDDNHGLISLLNRLQASYGLSFCDKSGCKDVNILIEDLREFLLRSKELLNLPVSERLNKISEWFPAFYDFKMHKSSGDRRSVKNPDTETPAEFFARDNAAFNTAYSYDLYLRLTRDQNYINSWIKELETLDKTIKDDIEAEHGRCPQGQGLGYPDSVCYGSSGVYLRNDYGELAPFYGWSNVPSWGGFGAVVGPSCQIPDQIPGVCGETGLQDCRRLNNGWTVEICCTGEIKPCVWKGTYYTCCNQKNLLVVCSQGDLYDSIPEWCSHFPPPDRVSCSGGSCNGCSVSTVNDCGGDGKSFQGQLSYRPPCTDPNSCNHDDSTSGPTEVEQAIRILRALKDNIPNLEMVIAGLADDVAAYLPAEDAKRNVIVYAWKDRPKPDGGKQFSHLVQVKVDGYPKYLPHVTESMEWGIVPQKCRVLNDYQGDFRITTWRYDQDQPTNIAGWNLRRGKGSALPEPHLEEIAADIQDNGKIDTTQDYVDFILRNFAITSCSQAHYGPEKSDIYITGTKCD